MGTGTALALVNTAIAKLDDRAESSAALVQKIINPTGRKGGGRSHNTSAGRYDGSARAAGRKAGAGIDLSTGGSPSLGSGKRKQLGS